MQQYTGSMFKVKHKSAKTVTGFQKTSHNAIDLEILQFFNMFIKLLIKF